MTYKEDVMNHQHRKPRIRLRLVFNLHDVAIGIGLLFCLDKILVCNGQKPINLGGVKRRDVYIAGFFPYGRHVPESHIGRGVMPSVKLAVDHINDNPTILRNYRLHMWWNDTECNAAVGVKAFFDMMHSGPHKLMLFGAACTQVTDPIAKASKHWRLTQLSYADTHPMFTSDNFPNFFRIVPSENAFNAPRVALLNHFNWTRVGTLYQNEPRYALAHNRLVADLDDNKMEVVEAQSFATEVTAALDKLKRKDVRIILGNFNEIWARKIFCEAYRYKMFGRKYQWVIMGTYTEKWWLETDGGCETAELIEALHGAILTDLLPLSTERQITISGITPDEYQIEYDSRRGNEYSRFHGYTYDGIWAVALAVQHVARRIRHFRRNQTVADFKYRDPLWENLFLEALKNTSFEGVTGPVRFYDNERKAYILLKQFQNGSEVKVGEYDGVTGTLDLSRGQSLIWRGRAPPKDRTVHVIEPSTVNITIYSIIATAASIGIIMAAVFLAINIKHRNQRYIKMSSPHLNNLIIVGCMLTYSSVIFLGLDSTLSSVTAFPYICTARAWLLMAGFSLAFGAMFSKTWRVHSIFTDVKLNKKVIKDYQLFMVVGVLLVIDLAIMTTWQVADPFYRETKQMEPYPHPSSDDIVMIPENEYCQSERMTLYLGGIYAYKGLLMIFGAFLAWETRHVSIPALNDSKYVGMSVYNVVIMCVTGAAISFVLADKQDTMFIMLSIFIIFCSTGTLCLVFVPKLIELRRNPQGAIDKRIRATLRPSSKTRRDSVVSELEERLKEATKANQKFRKELIEKDAEIELYMRRLGDSSVQNKDETIRKISIPQSQETLIKKEGPSMMTETTDISISLCSLTSTTAATQPEGEYVNVMSMHNQQSITGKTPFATKSSDGVECSSLLPTANNSTKNDKYQMNHGGECQEKEPLIKANLESEGALCDSGITKRNIEVASIETTIEESEESIVLEETDIIPYVTGNKSKLKEKGVITDGEKSQRRLPTPPPSKNVSFGELQEQCYLEQAILPPPVQFIPKHRHQVHHQALTKRKGSVKNNGLAHSHHQLLEKRRTSVPTNTISYISTDNVSKTEAVDGKFDHSHVVTECTHRRGTNLSGSTGYRCEKHGGGLAAVRGTHVHTTASGAANGSVEISRKHRDPGTILSYSDTEKQDMSGEGMIQRSVSEKSREKYFHTRSNFDRRITECRHRTASRKHRECRHMESKLRQQARLEYVQSTPNVATIHNSKFASTNPRSGRGVGGGGCGGTGRGVSGSGSGSAIGGSDDTGGGGCGNGVDNRRCDNGVEIRGSYNKSDSSMVSSGKTAIDVNGSGTSVTVSGSTVDISHMYSAVSDGELLDLEILPIFQKLLTERHKTTARGSYGANIASCPNISIKCDIVEYL